MSLQLVDAANPRAREELRERLRGLVQSTYGVMVREGDNPGTMEARSQTQYEQLKTLYFALTGYGATEDEMQLMLKPDEQ